LRRKSWLRSELTIRPNPGRSARPHAIPARRPAGHESAGEDSGLCPAVRTHFACAMDDGALLLNTACSPVSTRHDSTVYLFASRQKSPTNNLLGQRISHTVLSEFPDASLRTYPRLATREQGQARPGKGTCSVEHNALGQFMASRIRRSARSPSLPATSDSTIAVAGTTESNGPITSTVTGRTGSATSAACENRGSVMTRIWLPGRRHALLARRRRVGSGGSRRQCKRHAFRRQEGSSPRARRSPGE